MFGRVAVIGVDKTRQRDSAGNAAVGKASWLNRVWDRTASLPVKIEITIQPPVRVLNHIESPERMVLLREFVSPTEEAPVVTRHQHDGLLLAQSFESGHPCILVRDS
jgi:hypothetical protein